MATPDADGHEEINFQTVSNLTIKDGQLYWKREKLKTETQQKLVLSLPQKISAIILSTCVSVAAILTPIGQYVADIDKICPNTNFSFPYCESWKTRHELELKAKTVAPEPTPTPPPGIPTAAPKKPEAASPASAAKNPPSRK